MGPQSIAQSTTSIPQASASVLSTATPILTVDGNTFTPISYTPGGLPTYVVNSQTLTPGGTIIATDSSGTLETLSLVPAGTAVVVIAQSTTITSQLIESAPTSAPALTGAPILADAPLITIGGTTYTAVSYTQGSRPTFLVNGQTLSPGGQISTPLSNGVTAVSLDPTGSFIAFVAPSTTLVSEIALAPTHGPEQVPLPVLTIKSNTYTAAPDSGVGVPTYVIQGQTLTPGGQISTSMQGGVNAISLDLSGYALKSIAETTTRMSQIASSALNSPATTSAPVLSIHGNTYTAMANTAGGLPTYMIEGQTLTPGGMISTALPGGVTAISLDPGGTAVAFVGQTSTSTSRLDVLSTSTGSPSTIPPVLTINGDTFTAVSYAQGGQPTYLVNGQTLTPGGQISTTLPGGISAISLESTSSALQFLGDNTVLTSQITTSTIAASGTDPSDMPTLTFNGDTYTATVFSDDAGVAYIIDSQTLMPGGAITLTGSNGVNTVQFDNADSSLIASNADSTTTLAAPGFNVVSQTDVSTQSMPAAPAQSIGFQPTAQPTGSQEQPTLSPVPSVPTPSATSSETAISLSAATSPYVTSSMSSRSRTRTTSSASGLVESQGPMTTYMSGGTTLATTIGGSTRIMSMSTRVMITTPMVVVTLTEDGSTSMSISTGSAYSITRDATVRTMVMGGVRTSYVTGGTTVVAPSTLIDPSSAPSATNVVAEQRIGMCPEYNGLLYSSEERSGSALVTCGNIYEGQVAANDTEVDAEGCDYSCVDMLDCMAFSYTENGCNLYSDVSGMRISEVPVFSALRLRTVQKAVDTTTLSAMPSTTATTSSGFMSSLASLFSSALGRSSTDLSTTTISSDSSPVSSNLPSDESPSTDQEASSGASGPATLTDMDIEPGQTTSAVTGTSNLAETITSTGEEPLVKTIHEGSTLTYESDGTTYTSVAQSEIVTFMPDSEVPISQQDTTSLAGAGPSSFIITYITGGSTLTYVSAGRTYTSVEGESVIASSGFGVAPTPQLPNMEATSNFGTTPLFTATFVTGGSTTTFSSGGQLYTSVDGGTIVETVADGPLLSDLPCQSGCLLPTTAVPGASASSATSGAQSIANDTLIAAEGSIGATDLPASTGSLADSSDLSGSTSDSTPSLAASHSTSSPPSISVPDLEVTMSLPSITPASITELGTISTVWGFQISYAWPSMVIVDGSITVTSTPSPTSGAGSSAPTSMTSSASRTVTTNAETELSSSSSADDAFSISATGPSSSLSASPSSMCQADTVGGQVLQNSDFCTDDMSGWSSGISSEVDPAGNTSAPGSTSSGRATVAVISRRAVISYARSTTEEPTSAWIGQPINATEGGVYNVTANLWITMPDDTSSVSFVMLQLGNTTVFSTGNITASQNYTISVNGAATSDMTAFRLISAYSGEQEGAVALDNVYVSFGSSNAPLPVNSDTHIAMTATSSPDTTNTALSDSTLAASSGEDLSPLSSYALGSGPVAADSGTQTAMTTPSSPDITASTLSGATFTASPSLELLPLSSMSASEPYLPSTSSPDMDTAAQPLTADLSAADLSLVSQSSSVISTQLPTSSTAATDLTLGVIASSDATQSPAEDSHLASLTDSATSGPTPVDITTSQASMGSAGPQASDLGAIVSSTSTSSLTTLAAALPTVSGSAVCPDNDGNTYDATDGSQYTVLCNQEYDTQRMMTVDSPTLDDCINQCAGQAQCMGTTYSIANGTCQVSSSMSSSNKQSNARVASVLRVRAPTVAQANVQTVLNPTFIDDTLSPWVAAGASDGSNFAAISNTASASFNFSQLANENVYNGGTPQATVWLRQWVNVTMGYSYFVSMNVNLTNGGDNTCQIGMMSGVQSLVSYSFPVGQSYYGSINGSGIITNEGTDYAMIYGSCSGNFDTTISVFNIVWNAWPPVSNVASTDNGVSSGSPINMEAPATLTSQLPQMDINTQLPAPVSSLDEVTSSATQPIVAIGDLPFFAPSTTTTISLNNAESTIEATTGGAVNGLSSIIEEISSSAVNPTSVPAADLTSSNTLITGSDAIPSSMISDATATVPNSNEAPNTNLVDSTPLSSISSKAPFPTASFEVAIQTSIAISTESTSPATPPGSGIGFGTPIVSSGINQQASPVATLINSQTSATTSILTDSVPFLSTSSTGIMALPSSSMLGLGSISSSATAVIANPSAVVPSSVASPAAPTSTLCPGYSNCTYTGRDGSTYLIVTAQVYESLTIPGIPAFLAVSLAVCIDFCTLQGTQCQGVSWRPDTQQCRLKANMIPTGNTTYPSVGAIRMSSSLAISAEVLVNGAFAAGMASWTTFTTGVTDLVVRLLNLVLGILGGGVGCIARLPGLGGLLNTLLSPLELVLVQTVNVAAGYSFFLQADLIIVNANFNTDASCWIYFRSENEVLWSGLYDRTSTASTIYGSGTLAAVATRFQAAAQCNGTTDLTVTFDNLSWKTYPRAIGISPINLQPMFALTNSAFNTALGAANGAWRIGAGTTSTIATTISGGLASMYWGAISATPTISTLLQDLAVGAQANQNFALTALVTVTIPPGLLGGLALCSAGIYLNESLWASGALAASQTFNVNARGTLKNDATQLSLWAQCSGSSPPRVTWDNVDLTLNPA